MKLIVVSLQFVRTLSQQALQKMLTWNSCSGIDMLLIDSAKAGILIVGS